MLEHSGITWIWAFSSQLLTQINCRSRTFLSGTCHTLMLLQVQHLTMWFLWIVTNPVGREDDNTNGIDKLDHILQSSYTHNLFLSNLIFIHRGLLLFEPPGLAVERERERERGSGGKLRSSPHLPLRSNHVTHTHKPFGNLMLDAKEKRQNTSVCILWIVLKTENWTGQFLHDLFQLS